MSAYSLGVDLGTTYTAAAVARGTTAEPLPLGTDSVQAPSVVLMREDGEVLVGDAAERRAVTEPTRAAREFKRRLGDPVPIVIGDAAHPVESLMAHQLRDVVRRATEQEGEAPSIVVLTHPANYSDYKTGLLRQAAAEAGLPAERLVLVTEPEAAAIAYSRQARIDNGEIVAVYDFGGGTFDAALVRRTDDRFELIGVPEGMERLGGIDFDQAVMAHVDTTLAGLVSGADRSDPLTRPAQARLRSDCRRAKEALSTDSDTTIPVSLPGVQTEVRLTRDEFESMVRPRVGETVKALERAVASAHIEMDQVARILLVGGTSRMPIVAEMLRSATGRPVALDAHPKLAIAVGAALAGTSSIAQPAAAPAAASAAPAWQAPARAPAPPAEVVRAPGGGRRKGLIIGAVGGGIGIAAVVVALALGGGGGGSPTGDGAGLSVQTSVSAATPAATTVASVVESAAQVVDTSIAAPSGRGVAAIVSEVSMGPAPISDIRAITVDPQGAVYIVGADAAVLRVGNGESTVIGSPNAALGVPGGIAVTSDGTVLLSTPTGVQSIGGGGAPTVLLDAATAGLGATPGPIALDGVGNLYLADNDTHRIIRRGTDGSLSLIAGSGAAATPGPLAGDGQPAGLVPIGSITGLAVDPAGNLLFADSTTLAVRRVVANGTLSTLAGGGAVPVAAAGGSWIADGTAANTVAFLALDGLAVDASSRVYVTDSVSGAIVRISADGTVALVIARQVGVETVDGVAARESAVSAVGAVSTDRAGTLYFEDGPKLRSLPAA